MKRKYTRFATVILLMLSTDAFTQTIPSYIPANGLVAWYPFNGNANDESGNGINGTNNGATLTTDRFGNGNSAYSFNGVSNYISFSAIPSQQLDSLTISFWIKPNSLSQVGMAIIYGNDDGNTPTANGFQIGIANGSQSCITSPDNVLSYIHSGIACGSGNYSFIDTITWVHIILQRDSGLTKIYVNGSLTHTTTFPIASPPTLFRVGSATGIRFFNGVIDDISLHNRPLSTQEILSIYQSGNSLSLACDTLYYSTTNNAGFGQIVESTDGNIVVVGTEDFLYNWTNGDIVLSKYDTSFNLIWSKKFYVGGGMDIAEGLINTSDGGYLIHSAFGNSNPAGSFSAGYVIKTDSAGNQEWVQTLTGQSYGDNYKSVVVENSLGEFVCYGHVQHHAGCSSYSTRITKLSATGSIVWSNCISLNPDWTGGIIKLPALDNYISAYNNSGDIEFRKWDDSGVLMSQETYKFNNLYNSSGSVQKCQTGGFYALGTFNSIGAQKNAFIAKFDDAMNLIWEAADSTYIENNFYTMTEDSLGNIFCTGRISGVGQPNDLVVTMFNNSGFIQNKGIFGGPSADDYAQGIVTLSNGDIICSGRTDSLALLVKFCGFGNNTTGIIENNQMSEQIKVYPNPTKGNLNLVLVDENYSPITIKISDMMGKIVWSETYANIQPGSEVLNISVNSLKMGIYFLHSIQGKKIESEKFIIAR